MEFFYSVAPSFSTYKLKEQMGTRQAMSKTPGRLHQKTVLNTRKHYTIAASFTNLPTRLESTTTLTVNRPSDLKFESLQLASS